MAEVFRNGYYLIVPFMYSFNYLQAPFSNKLHCAASINSIAALFKSNKISQFALIWKRCEIKYFSIKPH